jgi:hypothetical protein
MLFGVFFMEKNAKKKKKKKNMVLRKVFYLISPQQEHFRIKFNHWGLEHDYLVGFASVVNGHNAELPQGDVDDSQP